MADKDDDAGRASGPADGRRRREPPTIDVKAVEMPVAAAASAESSSEASASEASSSEAAASAAPPPAARPRTPWFPVLAAGTLGAGLAVLAGGAAWVYFAPLDDRGTDELSARWPASNCRRRAWRKPLRRKQQRHKSRRQRCPTWARSMLPRSTNWRRAWPSLKPRPQRRRPKTAGPTSAGSRNCRRGFPGSSPRRRHRRRPIPRRPRAMPPRSRTCRRGSPGSKPRSPPSRRRPRPIRRSPAGSPPSRRQVKPIAEHVAELDRQNADNATTVQETRERAETVAKAMAEVNRADADQDKLHQSTKAELAGLNGRLDAVETLAKAIRDRSPNHPPRPRPTSRFASPWSPPACDSHWSGASRSRQNWRAAKAVGVDPAHARRRRAIRGHRRAESARTVPRTDRAGPGNAEGLRPGRARTAITSIACRPMPKSWFASARSATAPATILRR